MSSEGGCLNRSQDPNVTRENQCSAAIAQAAEINYVNDRVYRSVVWGSVNAAAFSLIFMDLINRCTATYTLWHKVEYGLCVLLFINTVYHVCCFIYYFRTKDPLEATRWQQYLLNIKNADTSATKVADTSLMANNSSLNITAFSFDRSRRETSLNASCNGNTSRKESPNISNLSPSSGTASKSMTSTSPGFGVKTNSVIQNEDLLNQYLKDYDVVDKFAELQRPKKEQSVTKIWSHPSSSEPETLDLVRNLYQLASTVTDESIGKTTKDKISPMMKYGFIDFWKRRGINPNHVNRMCDDLRVWISSTILMRVVEEINATNEHFMKHGQSELRIGYTAIERLRKNSVLHNSPTSFSTLIPFIDFSNNQEYVVHRIKELAKSRCMSDFRWNAGSLLFHGKAWDTHLPTDSAIIMHLLATYLDGQLVPLPQQPDGKPFTSQYLCTNVSEKPVITPGVFKIHQTELNPPNYVLVTEHAIHEPAKGRNNLFHTIVLFLQYIKKFQNGMLGRVNLGPAGVNILWVVDK